MKKIKLFSLIFVLSLSISPMPAAASASAVDSKTELTQLKAAQESETVAIVKSNDGLLSKSDTEITIKTNDLEIGALATFQSVKSEECASENETACETADNNSPILESSTNLIITEIAARICPDDKTTCSSEEGKSAAFVEIYNDSDLDFTLTGWSIQYAPATAGNNYLPGNWSSLANIDVELSGKSYLALSGAVGNASNGYVRIIDENGEVIDLVGYGLAAENATGLTMKNNQSIQRCELPDGTLDGFSLFQSTSRDVGIACPEPEPPVLVNFCSGLIISEIGANLDRQFVEIYNPTNSVFNLKGCQIQTNRNSKSFVFGEENLPANSYRTIWIADSELTLTKTSSGAVYILSSDGQAEVDSVSYSNLAKETSWIFIDGEWKQTYALTPDAANVWQEYPACEAGYERNLETGRCRKVPVEAVLAPCAEGQYRNPETGRCKKIDSGSILTPCKEGEERNPLTNRCRKIASDDGLKPCAEGYERNPETNRCRKIVESAPAAFAIDGGSGGGISGMWRWAVGGVIAAMLAVVAWQYRAEIGRATAKITTLFRAKKNLSKSSENFEASL